MIVPCPNCGQKNRLAADRLSDGPVCGNCKSSIDAPSAPVKVEPGEFDDLLNQSDKPVFVDFWAPWCGPCQMVAPEVETFATNHAGEMIVAKVNTEEHPQVAQKQGVRGIPMFALYDSGEQVETATGYMSAEQLEQTFSPR